MEPQSSNPIAPRLEPVLRQLRKRIRRVIASRGALITIVTALAGLLVIAAVDFLFSPLPVAVRWLSPLVWGAAVLGVGVVWWWRPLCRPLSLIRIARWLEIHHPELDERLSTVLEVSSHEDSGVSSELIGEIAKEASRFLDQIDPQVEVNLRRAKPWLWPAAALLVLWGVLFTLWPDSTSRHLVRALVPGSSLGNAGGQISVTPGSFEAIEGDSLEIKARHSDGPGTNLTLVLHLKDGSTAEMPMQAGDDGSIYQLGSADRSFTYQVRAGRETSDTYQVTVWPKPRLADARVRLDFPAYTGWAAREQSLGDGISAIAGTKVELTSKLNTPVVEARLEIDGENIGATTLDHAADGGGMSTRWTMENPGHSTGRVVLKHRIGREFDAADFRIESLPDTPPEVKWLSAMREEMRLRRDDLLETGYEITDDVGLGAVRLEVKPERGDSAKLAVDTPPQVGRGETPVWRGHVKQPIGELVSRWPDSRVFKLRMHVEDSRPAELKGPGVGVSEWIVVRIDDGAQSLARQELFASHSDARETIEEARRLAQQAREKIDRRRYDLKENPQNKESQKDLAEAREQLAEARENLEQLADRMEESVHATKADDVRKAAETLEQARQDLEKAPLQDTAEQRDQTAELARKNVEDAERQLDKLREDIQRTEPQLQDFAKLKDLEQRQRELARQAEQELAENNGEPSEQWQQQQDRMAEELRQTAQQQPQTKAEALQKQAEQARQLAAEAREQAAGQEALKQTASQQADPQQTPEQAIREQLAGEQEKIAEEVREQLADARERQDNDTANALPEAVESAENASTALKENQQQSAAEEANKAAEQLAETSKSAADKNAAEELADLAEREKALAEALHDLDQGNAGQAAAKLSEMRAEQAAELADEIKDSPQVNGTSGPMQQAANTSEQAATQAKQAAQSESQGKPAEAAGNHGDAQQKLEQTAAQLDQAATEFAQQAAEAAGQKPGDHQAPVPAQPLAEAFQQASQAADASGQAQAASHSQAAADALAQAAEGTMRAMQGQSPPKPGPPGQPGDRAEDSPFAERMPEADPGLPPELAKLGITASDWEKIKSSLGSDVGGTSTIALPEEYRDLVRRYFEEITKGSSR